MTVSDRDHQTDKGRRRAVLRVWLVAGGLLAALLCVRLRLPHLFYLGNLLHPVDYLVWELDHKKYDAMHAVEVGMTEREVVALLGPPEIVDRRPVVTQTHGAREEYGKEIANPNKCFWYSTGVDIQACIVFDRSDRVAYVNVGGT